uniref:Transmembrane protein n=1 Tax=Octopus bimaculoides TaxID=37653 RepID=A0A0L8FJI1_OCTBM
MSFNLFHRQTLYFIQLNYFTFILFIHSIFLNNFLGYNSTTEIFLHLITLTFILHIIRLEINILNQGGSHSIMSYRNNLNHSCNTYIIKVLHYQSKGHEIKYYHRQTCVVNFIDIHLLVSFNSDVYRQHSQIIDD